VIRRLLLLRHAKSDWSHGVPDHERPLAPRGRRDADAAGRLLASDGPLPELVLCSTATRTWQTWQRVAAALPVTPRVTMVPDLYQADVDDVVHAVAGVEGDVGTLLVVGHEPAMSGTATALAGPESTADDLTRLRAKYPTSGLAVLRFDGAWADIAPGTGVLERFAVPRG
jgi:phosphohistidine phosphatase